MLDVLSNGPSLFILFKIIQSFSTNPVLPQTNYKVTAGWCNFNAAWTNSALLLLMEQFVTSRAVWRPQCPNRCLFTSHILQGLCMLNQKIMEIGGANEAIQHKPKSNRTHQESTQWKRLGSVFFARCCLGKSRAGRPSVREVKVRITAWVNGHHITMFFAKCTANESTKTCNSSEGRAIAPVLFMCGRARRKTLWKRNNPVGNGTVR